MSGRGRRRSRADQVRSAWPPARSAMSRDVLGERHAVAASAGGMSEGLGDHGLAGIDRSMQEH